jgi:general secretion pathway protein D
MKIKDELHHNLFLYALFALAVSGCSQKPFKDSPGHLPPLAELQKSQKGIPKPVLGKPFLPPPVNQRPEQRYTVVVHDVPVRELLFALARDAKVNVDIAPGISGNASLNAIDQTLPQILERLKRQIDIRYQLLDGTLVVSADLPYIVQYSVPYINLSRSSESEVSIATQISSTGTSDPTAGGGGSSGGSGSGSSNSATNVKNSSSHLFWETLLNNIRAILNNQDSMRGDKGMSGAGPETQTEKSPTDGSIIANQESGVIAVKASEKQHREIRKYIDNVVEHASRQVLIEATIVEVALSDEYQAGIDWRIIAANDKFKFEQSFQDLLGTATTAAAVSAPPVAIAVGANDVLAAIKMLDTFGNSRVLSSPKLMVLNNQTAVLKVVTNIPYFTTKAEISGGTATTTPITAFTTELHTVPVGLVMNVTPQISDNNSVIINARPTVSRVNGFVEDPNPAFRSLLNPVKSEIPRIEVREMESILKVGSGDIGVIGGLMQDSVENTTEGTPGLNRMDYIDNLFSFKKRDNKKTELVVFLRPRVIKTASTQGELKDFNTYLENPPVKFEVPEFK